MSQRGYNYAWVKGPGPNGRPVLTLDGIPVQGNMLKDAIGFRGYDTVRIQAGNAITTDPFKFFQVPQGQLAGGLNFTTQYRKGVMDTNMEVGGMFSKGRLLEVSSIQARVTSTGATDTTYGSSGAATQLPTNALGAAVVSAVNEEKMITEAITIKFVIDNKDYEEGPLLFFPSNYGYSGFAGSGAPGGSGAGTDAIAIVNSGFGRSFRLPTPRMIDGLRAFNVTMTPGYSFTPNRNSTIQIILEGLLWRPVN